MSAKTANKPVVKGNKKDPISSIKEREEHARKEIDQEHENILKKTRDEEAKLQLDLEEFEHEASLAELEKLKKVEKKAAEITKLSTEKADIQLEQTMENVAGKKSTAVDEVVSLFMKFL